MNKEEFYYKSSNNINTIHAVKWIPKNNIKAIIQISHGTTEHIERYEELAKYLNKLGILVVGNSHLGHGKTDGTKMYFGPKGSWNYIVKDMDKCKSIIQEEYPNIPYYMLGFSLGSFAIRTYLIDYNPNIYGAILVGTGYNSNIEINLATLLTNIEAKKHGEDKPTKLIRELTFGSYNKIFKPNKTDYDWLSLSEKNIKNYINDPLRGGNMSSGLFRELLSGIKYTSNLNNINKINKSTPILLLSGDKDPVGKQTKGIIKVYNLFKKANIQNIEVKFYKNLRHDILHEDKKEEIYEYINKWISNYLKDN